MCLSVPIGSSSNPPAPLDVACKIAPPETWSTRVARLAGYILKLPKSKPVQFRKMANQSNRENEDSPLQRISGKDDAAIIVSVGEKGESKEARDRHPCGGINSCDVP
jgi:hypothetical protein